MAKARLPVPERIETAGALITRARIFHDIWWFYEGIETREPNLETMNEYSEFFRFDSHAHFVSMIVYLCGLFEERKDTINFNQLLRGANESKEFSGDAVERSKKILEDLKQRELLTKVSMLRSNLFAHRSAKKSYEEAFEKAALTPDQLKQITEAGLEIANIMLEDQGLQTRSFHESSVEDLAELLKDLGNRQSDAPRS